MAKRYFTSKEKSGLSLGKVAAVTVVVLALAASGIAALWHVRATPAAQPPAEDAAMRMTHAKEQLSQNDFKGAEETLRGIAFTVSDPDLGPQAALALAEAIEKQGRAVEALPVLDRAVKEYGAGPHQHELTAQYAQALDAAGRKDEAAQLRQRIVTTAPPGQQGAALLGLAQAAEAQNQTAQALSYYRSALNDAAQDSEPWMKAVEGIGRLQIATIFAPGETPDSKWYTVAQGDNLNGIGMKLNTTQGLLLRANNLAENPKLSIGQRLKYTPKDFRIVIDRSNCRLYLLDKDGLFKLYLTGLGMPDHPTTPGNYTIGNKEKNPTWHRPGGPPVPPLDPQNELGTRWMPLVPSEAGLPKDLGIHGTIHPETIGDYKSHGCPRMRKEDVEELYDLVVRSTPVTIVEKYELPKSVQ